MYLSFVVIWKTRFFPCWWLYVPCALWSGWNSALQIIIVLLCYDQTRRTNRICTHALLVQVSADVLSEYSNIHCHLPVLNSAQSHPGLLVPLTNGFYWTMQPMICTFLCRRGTLSPVRGGLLVLLLHLYIIFTNFNILFSIDVQRSAYLWSPFLLW